MALESIANFVIENIVSEVIDSGSPTRLVTVSSDLCSAAQKVDEAFEHISLGLAVAQQSERVLAEADAPRTVFVDASLESERTERAYMEEDRAQLQGLVGRLEPELLGLCDWGPVFWCLYARAMAGGGKAVVLLPTEALADFGPAQTLLLERGLIERACYVTTHLRDRAGSTRLVAIVLSDGNASVDFIEYGGRALLGFQPSTPRGGRASITFAATHTVQELLSRRCGLALDSVKLLDLARGYPARLGELFERLPPLMLRDSTQSRASDAVCVRRISSQDFRDGTLLPASSDDRSAIRIDPAVLARYELRVGDLVMPRAVGRGRYANPLVISPEDTMQHLVSSHNTVVLRPRRDAMTEDERIAYSEMMAYYLTEGHGGDIISALAEERSFRSPRPYELAMVEIPPELDYRTVEYAEHVGEYLELGGRKTQAEQSLARARRELESAQAAIAAHFKQ